MSARQRTVRLLVRLYPAAWRREYGAELADILTRGPLTAKVVADVAGHALWQRLRMATPATLLGTGCALLAGAGVVLTPTAYGHNSIALVGPSGITFPPIRVAFMTSELFVMLLIGCGCWTYLRRPGRIRDAAMAAAKMTLIAGLPVTIAAVLYGAGVLDLTFLAPGGLGTAEPSAWVMAAAPVFRLGESAIWGAVGGTLGRRLSRSRPSAASG